MLRGAVPRVAGPSRRRRSAPSGPTDPDSLLVRSHEAGSSAEFEDTVVVFTEDHEAASDLTALQEGKVFRGGSIHVGPLQHLLFLERYAISCFPDIY